MRTINGTAGDILDYETHRETGLTVIAIGGDKLARGLTLEGLERQLFPPRQQDVRHIDADGALVRLPARLFDLCRLYTTVGLTNGSPT